MTDVQQRPSGPRGRGSGRGGRGGYSSRGGRHRQANGEKIEASTPSYEEEGEIGQLKKKYATNLGRIKEMFPDWTEDDIVFALEENGNDVERTVDRMSEGNVSQWGEVKKKTKERASVKTKDSSADNADVPSRGGRSRAGEGHRSRGRATERGRGGGRGRARDATAPRKPAVTDINHETPVADTWDTPVETTATVDGWEQAAQAAATTSEDNSWEVVTPPETVPLPAVEQPQQSSRPDGTRTWASMLKPAAKPKPAVPLPKAAPAPQPAPEPAAPAPLAEAPPPVEDVVQPTAVSTEAPQTEEAHISASPSLPPSEPALELTPSKDQLTESNLEQVEDVSEPPATITVASTAGTMDPRSAAGSVTPAHAIQHQPSLRPGLGGYQTTALKATSGAGRSSSFIRRVKEQQEAVVMPGNHAVDRTAVQFGSMGLGGSAEDLDVDDEREEPETRTQPPQHSPVAPKASLPPVPQQPTEILKPAPGLVAPSHPGPISQPEQVSSQPATHGAYSYNQFSNLYGSSASQSAESNFPAPKAYEPFGQQAPHPSSTQGTNGFPPQSQAPSQPSQTAHQNPMGGFTTATNEYSSYYTSDNARNPYHSAYGTYGQQPQAPQENSGAQQKPASSFTSSAADHPSQTAPSQGGLPPQNRFGPSEPQNSGHSTPNPVTGQQAQGPGQQPHQMGQAHNQGHQHAGYPYGGNAYYNNYYHPGFMSQHAYGPERGPYDDIRRYEADHFMSQNHHYGYGGNQGRYGSGPYGGGGKYGQPHQNYGISPQSWDAHSASPANVGGYGQQAHSMSGRDNASSLGGYGRTGSTQPSESQQQHSANTFGNMPDPFGSRSQSSFANQASQQPAAQQSGTEDASRGFGETSKIAGGPSPAPGQTTGRPTSAANMQGQTSQGQSQQSYAGYPQLGSQMHGQQSHYGSGLGGLGHQHPNQGHHSGYGNYGGFGGGNYYGGNTRW